MTKEEMIVSIATAGVAKTYIALLETMSEEEVREEYKQFTRGMKD